MNREIEMNLLIVSSRINSEIGQYESARNWMKSEMERLGTHPTPGLYLEIARHAAEAASALGRLGVLMAQLDGLLSLATVAGVSDPAILDQAKETLKQALATGAKADR